MDIRPRAAVAGIVACAALALAACQSTATGPLEAPKGATKLPGVEAVLIPKNGSAAQGDVKIMQRGDRLAVLVAVNNVFPGQYRVAIHERGNCSSPNAFSAGRPWAPAGYPRPAVDLLPEFVTNTDGNAQMSATVAGIRLTGPDSLEGRAVLVHAGSSVDANLEPGVPNRVVLCGAIGPIRSFMDVFN